MNNQNIDLFINYIEKECIKNSINFNDILQKYATKKYTFNQWKEKYLETYKKKKVRTKTLEEYRIHLNLISNTEIDGITLGEMYLDDIKRIHMQTAFNNISNYSKTVVKKCRFLTNSLFTTAKADDICKKNPMDIIDIIYKPSKEKAIWNERSSQ